MASIGTITIQVTHPKRFEGKFNILDLNKNRFLVIHFYSISCGGCLPCAIQMEKWSEDPEFNHVSFFCINVDEVRCPGKGLKVCEEYSSTINFQSCFNGMILSESDLPNIGQLGCSGLIFARPDGTVIHRSTPPFVQFREMAFVWMESFMKSFRPIGWSPTSVASKESTVSQSYSSNGPQGRGVKVPNSFRPSLESLRSDIDANMKKISSRTAKYSESDAHKALDEIVVRLFSSHSTSTHSAMDREHRLCVEALHHLVQKKSMTTLKKLYLLFRAHFKHEEELFCRIHPNSQVNRLDPAWRSEESHVMDHRAMLRMVEKAISYYHQYIISKTLASSSASTLPVASGSSNSSLLGKRRGNQWSNNNSQNSRQKKFSRGEDDVRSSRDEEDEDCCDGRCQPNEKLTDDDDLEGGAEEEGDVSDVDNILDSKKDGCNEEKSSLETLVDIAASANEEENGPNSEAIQALESKEGLIPISVICKIILRFSEHTLNFDSRTETAVKEEKLFHLQQQQLLQAQSLQPSLEPCGSCCCASVSTPSATDKS